MTRTSYFASPYIVASTLLQVQFSPSTQYLNKFRKISETTDYSNVNDSNDTDTVSESESDFEMVQDLSGYLLSNSLKQNQPFQLPPLPNSVTEVMVTISKNKVEGFTALWKCQFVEWFLDMSNYLVNPTVEASIAELLDINDDVIPLADLDTDRALINLTARVTGSIITGLLLSPLDIVKTRLIVQTSHPIHKTYKSTLDCFSKVVFSEDTTRTIFPTILYHSVANLMYHSKYLVISKILPLTTSPILLALSQFTFDILNLVVTFPLDTVRKRLYAQYFDIYKGANQMETCVLINPIPYAGFFNCFSRIVIEEGGDIIGKNGKVKEKRRWFF
ncbi:hypothetical protein HK099_004554 [Clydaea vesicula]|uniref:Mitochondrial carrier n=1 Tax=Clydaea vesicula TaxID=447962 RepID=A0AAD5U0M3_9FUNG|nr:hypothetical protein HK099_004554 [Clydaea vesicula]